MPENAWWIECEPCEERLRIATYDGAGRRWERTVHGAEIDGFFEAHAGAEHEVGFYEDSPPAPELEHL